MMNHSQAPSNPCSSGLLTKLAAYMQAQRFQTPLGEPTATQLAKCIGKLEPQSENDYRKSGFGQKCAASIDPQEGSLGAASGESGVPQLGFVPEGIGVPGVVADGRCREFWSKVALHLPAHRPHHSQSVLQYGLTSIKSAQILSQPAELQSAHAAMQSFMPQPAVNPATAPTAPGAVNQSTYGNLQQPAVNQSTYGNLQQPAVNQSTAIPSAGMPPAAPGHSTMTGLQQRPIGLDRPMDSKATALPGTPGHAATNVIDQQGALDPRGLTVDGNNAAGIKKLGASVVGQPQFATTGFLRALSAVNRNQKAAAVRRLLDLVQPAGQ